MIDSHTNLTNLTKSTCYARACHPAAISSKLHSFMPINRQSSHPTLISRRRQSRQARAKRRAICEIREICVKFNHLCENILVRLPLN